MPTLAQRRFTGGEIAPAYYPGVDLAKYSAAARTLQNFMVKRTGGIDNRAGMQFIGEVPFSFTKGRLIKFVFNDSQTYQLVFIDKKMFVVKLGAFITGTSMAVNAITNANSGVVTTAQVSVPGTPSVCPFADGDLVDFTAVGGMTQLNSRRFMVKNPSTYTFQLYDLDGSTKINTSAFPAFTSGGVITSVLTVTSPYAEADLADLHYIQSADTITFTRQGYPQYQLTRAGDASWTFTKMQFATVATPPTSLSLTFNGSAQLGNVEGYVITAVNATTKEESLPSAEATYAYDLSVDPTRWVAVAWGAVAGAGYYNVYKKVAQTGQYGLIAASSGTSYQDNFPGKLPDYTLTPPIQADPFNHISLVTDVTLANPGVFTAVGKHGLTSGNQVSLDQFTGLLQLQGLVGNVNVIDPEHFTLSIGGVLLDTTSFTKTLGIGRATVTGLWPATSCYYQERMGFANSPQNPIGANFSKSGIYKNFSISQPSQDSDAIQFNIVSREVNEIRHTIDVGVLVILTAGAEHAAQGDITGVLKPSAINRRQRSAIGSAKLQPLLVEDALIFLQAQGSKVYDLGLDVNIGSVEMKPKELTLLATHLTEGLSVTDWCYQKTPHSIIWAVRSDGQVIGLTYLKEQEVIAWHRHTIGGGVTDAIENVSCVPENGEHAVYFMSKRTVNGVTRRYIERMYSRSTYTNRPLSLAGWTTKGAVFLDACLSIDGRNQDFTNPIGVTGSAFTYTDTVTLTAAAATFKASDVGRYVFMMAPDDTVVRFHITAFTSSTIVSATPNCTVPVALQGGNTWQWAWAITTASGLWHLEGKKVAVFADGFVVASPNNPSDGYPILTVTNGSITLPGPYCVVNVGLPYVSTLETLNVDTANGESVIGKQKMIGKLNLWLEKTRGGFYGSELPANDAVDPSLGLMEMPGTSDSDDETPPVLVSDTVEIIINSGWNKNGRAVVRQLDPLPITVNGIAPEGLVPFGQGN